ncbi:MAG: VOC family protein [Thermomicrobiales bacterium]
MPTLLSPVAEQQIDGEAPEAPATIGLYEMALEVHDLAASERFYTEVVGLEVIDRWGEDRPAVWLALGGKSFLGLWSREAGGAKAIHHGRGGSHVHFAIRAPRHALPAYQARFEALGVPYEPYEFDNGNLALYLDDPDGNVVELSDFAVLWDGSDGTTRQGSRGGTR